MNREDFLSFSPWTTKQDHSMTLSWKKFKTNEQKRSSVRQINHLLQGRLLRPKNSKRFQVNLWSMTPEGLISIQLIRFLTAWNCWGQDHLLIPVSQTFFPLSIHHWPFLGGRNRGERDLMVWPSCFHVFSII